MDYTAEIFRFGGSNPRIDRDGNKTNLNHIAKFSPDELITDGMGQVLDHPLLLRKP